MQEDDTGDMDHVKSVITAFRIIEHLRESNGCRLTEVANSLGMAKSTAYRHLETLLDMEYVVKEGDVYLLGFRFLELGEHTKTSKTPIEWPNRK
ncbi:helix-turn-helix domain-containing protein [Salinigranum rubrum]|uniref:helix-turn-helix domain-containing protein n=1 Tax=Salinigranum rubrum TaxID=755307 RepID=UPI001FEB3F0C|nr:helix-turn-helix domain-containing protein [Salinigranum rubrum]